MTYAEPGLLLAIFAAWCVLVLFLAIAIVLSVIERRRDIKRIRRRRELFQSFDIWTSK